MEYKHEEYDKFIQSIIDTRGQWTDPGDGVWENHHIMPRCLGGLPEVWKHDTVHENLIWLSPEEHYDAHKLLYLENRDIFGLFAAWLGTTKNGQINKEDYGEIKRYNSKLPDFLLENIELAGEFHYNKRKEYIPTKDTTNYKIARANAVKAGIGVFSGESNGMYGKGYLVAGGNNGHASIRYFYKGITFECRKDLITYLVSNDINITTSAIRKVVHGTGTRRVYEMYKEVFDYLTWEYK